MFLASRREFGQLITDSDEDKKRSTFITTNYLNCCQPLSLVIVFTMFMHTIQTYAFVKLDIFQLATAMAHNQDHSAWLYKCTQHTFRINQ